MLNKGLKKELKRLRRDFEKQASKYSGLKFSVDYKIKGLPFDSDKFLQPAHAINLWQYIGNLTSAKDARNFLDFHVTDYGLSNAEVTVFGIIEGKKVELFKELAVRAGSLIEPVANQFLMMKVLEKHFGNPELTGKPGFSINGHPLAVWLNLVLVIISTYQPSRFQNNILAVDPFAASLSVFDYFFDNLGKSPVKAGKAVEINSMDSIPLLKKQFKVALTFPGEKRDYVSQVAEGLNDRLGDVFYDNYYEAELARTDLDLILQKIYHANSELVVVFLCEEYEKKEWCGIEWRAVRDLIKKRADKIMFMRFDNAEISGLFSIDGYIDLTRRTPEDAVELICRRYNAK